MRVVGVAGVESIIRIDGRLEAVHETMVGFGRCNRIVDAKRPSDFALVVVDVLEIGFDVLGRRRSGDIFADDRVDAETDFGLGGGHRGDKGGARGCRRRWNHDGHRQTRFVGESSIRLCTLV